MTFDFYFILLQYIVYICTRVWTHIYYTFFNENMCSESVLDDTEDKNFARFNQISITYRSCYMLHIFLTKMLRFYFVVSKLSTFTLVTKQKKHQWNCNSSDCGTEFLELYWKLIALYRPLWHTHKARVNFNINFAVLFWITYNYLIIYLSHLLHFKIIHVFFSIKQRFCRSMML